MATIPSIAVVRELFELLNRGTCISDGMVLRSIFNKLSDILRTCNFRRRNRAKFIKIILNITSKLKVFEPTLRDSCLKLLYTLFQSYRFRKKVFREIPGNIRDNRMNDLIGYGPHTCNFLLDVVTKHICDVEPNVRKVSLNLIRDLYLQNNCISDECIQFALKVIDDDNSEVRTSAMDIMFIRSKYGTFTKESNEIKKESSQFSKIIAKKRAQNSCFMKICQLTGDNSVQLRTKATGLLGCFKNVPKKTLLQTLSKEPLSPTASSDNLPSFYGKIPKSDNPALSRKSYNNKFGDKALLIKKNSTKNKAIWTGYCGAFVHGSEDEFECVRNYTLASMNSLCSQSSEFLDIALNYMIDMLNDETEGVRLNAIKSILKRAAHTVIKINEEKIECFITVLRDADYEVRTSAYKLFSIVEIQSSDIFFKFLDALISNVEKHKSDTKNINECLSNLGYNHAELIDTKFTKKLFNLDPRYVPRDARLEDDYICKLILIHYAIQKKPMIEASLPTYVLMQLPYIKAKYEDLHHTPSNSSKASNPLSTPRSSKNLFSDFTSLWKDVETFVNKGLFSAAISTFELCLNDTTKLLENRCDSLGSLYFLHSYAICCKLILQIKNDVRSLRIGAPVQRAAAIILALSYTIKALDVGITSAIDGALMTARIFSMASWMLVLFKQSVSLRTNIGELPEEHKQCIDELNRRIDITSALVERRDPEMYKMLFDIKQSLFRNISSSMDLTQMLIDIINNVPIKFPDIPFIIRRCMATPDSIYSSIPSDIPHTIDPLPPGICVFKLYKTFIENCTDLSHIAIMVFSNNNRRLYWPKITEFTRTDQVSYNLETNVPILVENDSQIDFAKHDLKLVYCIEPDVGLDLSIIDSIKNTDDEKALKVYAEENFINIAIGNRYLLHLNELK